MRRGHTSTIIMTSNLNLSEYDRVVLTIEDNYPIERKRNQVTIPATTIDGTKATFDLTQNDTLSLRAGTVNMQIRAASHEKKAVTSNIVTTTLADALKEGEL